MLSQHTHKKKQNNSNSRIILNILSILLTVSMVLSLSSTGVAAVISGNKVISVSGKGASFTPDSGREININSGWKFMLGTVSNGQSTSLDDSSWDSVTLPHDYSIIQNFTTSAEAESGFLPGGTGWYRRTFTLPSEYAGKSVAINFDGVYMNATVYVNGTSLGTHPYGYTPFSLDISSYITCDGKTENVIAVKVVNQLPSSRWYSGSGIYRSVSLTVAPSVHVAKYGSVVTTPQLSSQKGGNVSVNVATTVENDTSSQTSVTVRNVVCDSSDNTVSTTVSGAATVPANGENTVNTTLTVNNPTLWTVETDAPAMYYVKTEILTDGNVTDTYYTEFGFRYTSFSRTSGFSLNGQNIKLNGVCMHHDQGALGSADYYDAIDRQVKILKEMGCNAIRVTHNPASQNLIDICNRRGMMIVEEAFDTWKNSKNSNSYDYSRYFSVSVGTNAANLIGSTSSMTWAEYDIKQMIKRDRNAPCVIMWSMGNEISDSATTLNSLIGWAKDVDTTRPVTMGEDSIKNGGDIAFGDAITQADGVMGLNYSLIGSTDYYNTIYNNNTSWILYGSETASAIKSRGWYTSTGQDSANLQMSAYDYNAVGWGATAANSMYQTLTRDFVAGEFVWTGFDYIGEPTPWNGIGTGSVSGNGAIPNSSFFGIIDTAGFEKDVYYLYRSQWKQDNSTTLHLVPSAWDRDCLSGSSVPVSVYTNAPSIKLFLNGTQVGSATRTVNTTSAGHTYYTYTNSSRSPLYPEFNVTWASGTLSVKAYDENGNEITSTVGTSSVKTSSSPSKLLATVDKTEITADGKSLAYISVDVTDANGVIDPNASDSITFSLTGEGEILGADNGNQSTTNKYQYNVLNSAKSATINAFSGKALVIVRSTDTAGSFTVTVSAPSRTSSSVSVVTKATDTGSTDKTPVSYTLTNDYSVLKNEILSLQKTSIVTYSDNSTEELPITWSAFSTDTVGLFNVSGTIQTVNISVSANVTIVENNIVALLNTSDMALVGSSYTLPGTVTALLSDGTKGTTYPAEWSSTISTASEGVLSATASNTILSTLYGKTFASVHTVRVSQGTAGEDVNIASNSYSDAPALSESCIAVSDDLNSINNGINSDGVSTTERWTNYNNQNNSSDAYVQLTWQNSHTLGSVSVWWFTDGYSASFPSAVSFTYLNADGTYVEVSHTASTLIDYTAGATVYTFDAPVTTKSLRVNMTEQSGKCVGMTELSVFAPDVVALKNTTATLSSLTVGGKAVTLTSGTYSYTVTGTETSPSVSAVPADNAAVTVLNGSPIIAYVISEDGLSENVYNIIYTQSVPQPVDKSALDDLISRYVFGGYAELSASYTPESYTALVNAYDTAVSVSGNENASQSDVTAAATALENAFNSLEDAVIVNVDKTSLQQLIDAYTNKKYTANSWVYSVSSYNALTSAYNTAVSLNNSGTAGQAEVEAAANALEAAIGNLAYKKTPSVSMNVTSADGKYVITASIVPEGVLPADYSPDDYLPVVDHGIIYIRTSRAGNQKSLYVNTLYRTKVSFGAYKDDWSYVSRLKPADTSVSFKICSYIRYRHTTGIYVYAYSETFTGALDSIK